MGLCSSCSQFMMFLVMMFHLLLLPPTLPNALRVPQESFAGPTSQSGFTEAPPPSSEDIMPPSLEDIDGSLNVTLLRGSGFTEVPHSSGDIIPPGDVLITDVTASLLHGVISEALGHGYLSVHPLNEPPQWPLKGIVYGNQRRLMLSTYVTLSPRKAHANEVKPKMVSVHFLLDTGSSTTYLSEEAVKALAVGRFYYDMYGTVPVIINGVPLNVNVSPHDSRFPDICLMGADFLEAVNAELLVYYNGAESFTISKSEPMIF